MSDGEPITTAQPENRADFWFGLGLMALGFAVTFESWRMPRLAELNVNPMTAPGLVPGMIGLVLTGLGTILFLRAAQARWRRPAREPGIGFVPGTQTVRFVVALTLCLGYAVGLVGSLPFPIATAIFVFLFVLIFEWRNDRPLAGHARAILIAAGLAIVVAMAVTYVFEQVFLVRLP